ncbi:MAG: hypothetical protein QF532_04740 [Acidimicrobiales bacterium]|nr:hypothetical protein [Acidimicrobiales bacterium]
MAPVPVPAPVETMRFLLTDEAPTLRTAVLEPPDTVTLSCGRCEVTWRGRPAAPCWSCGAEGRRPTGTVLVAE